MEATAIKPTRSTIDPSNLQEVIDASISAKHATLGGQQQYETGSQYACFFNSLLPAFPHSVFDPQCASGQALKSGTPPWCSKFGFEIDNRFADQDDGVQRVIGNCVAAWEVLDDLYPELEFSCQNANPPFGCLWPTPDGQKHDSTDYTWTKIMERASPFGMGWFISNHKTIGRLGIDRHPRVYLYEKFPAGVWKNTEVEIGVVHWDVCAARPERQEVEYKTLDLAEHADVMARIRTHYRKHEVSRPEVDAQAIGDAFHKVQQILKEEKAKRSPFNVWLDPNGMLRIYLSTRFQTKRKLSREEVLRIHKVDRQHPLTFTSDREGRKLLAELVACGFYTIQPEALAAIQHALGEVNRLACPVMPVTEFECVAYAENEDHLTCIADFLNPAGERIFIKGKRYELTTNSYSLTEEFTRQKPHYNEQSGQMYTASHKCQLSGTDRYIAIQDDQERIHRFMERPQAEPWDHDETTLWQIFDRPQVRTVAESHPEVVRKNALLLSTCELLAGFTYYSGQTDYLARLSVKDYGVVAADTGCGKSLMALSLIQMKAPHRALIIAPQGTMRSSSRDGDDDEEETDYQASQWVEELRRYAPGLAVFQLFSMDDYHRILKANQGHLPAGVYITYYQAMFSNGARETAASSWNDERLAKEIRLLSGVEDFTLPEPPEPSANPDRYWCAMIGHERDGIRCILRPCMSTLIGHHFDFVALDEGHLCCNLGATTSQMLIRLQPKYRYVLSATPITNVVSNLFSLMGWVCVPDWFKGGRRNAAWPYARDETGRFIETFQSTERDFTQEQMNEAEDKKNKTRFKRGKCVKVSPIISAPARLLKLLKPNMAYISKPMVRPDYQPPKILDVRVPMGRQQMELYVHFMNRGNITNPDGTPCNALVRARKQITYLRNICADPAGFDHGGPKVKSNFNPKTVAILELARDIIAKGDPFVIVCARKGQTDTLHRALKEAGVLLSRIDSTVSAEQHSHQSNLFKAHKTQGLLLGMRCANSYSFSECPCMIIGSLEYSWGSLAQARGRVDRVNSQRPATIYCVLHKHSLEEVIFDVVGTKSDSASICLQGRRVPRHFKPLDLSEVLAMSITGFKSESVDESDCEAQWPKLRQRIADSL